MAERILYEEHPAMFKNHPLWFVICILLVAALGAGLVILLFWWLNCLGTKLTVSDQRSTLRRGLLSRKEDEVFHADVRNIQLSQTLFQRIFRVGSIGLSSAGQSGIEIVASGIPNPDRVKEIIDRYRLQNRAGTAGTRAPG